MIVLPEIKVPPHMKLVGRQLVPKEYNDAQTRAYIMMKQSGHTCNASAEGFRDYINGERENPYSVIRDTIRAMKWREGFDQAKRAI